MGQRNLKRYPSAGKYNSLWYWKRVVPPWKVFYNYFMMRMARIMPLFSLKIRIYRLMGIRVGCNVSIAPAVTVDFFFPQLIEIGNNTIIGYDSLLLCHEFLIDEYVIGPVNIGKDVLIGAKTTVLPGVTIADGSVISAHSLVNSDIEGFAGGVPARQLDRQG